MLDLRRIGACPMTAETKTARRRQVLGWLLMVIGLAVSAISIPVDGPAGAGLGLGSIALLWTAWRLIIRAGRVGGTR